VGGDVRRPPDLRRARRRRVALGSVACAHAPISVAVAVALVAAASDTRRR
jgi:hypothetical protein